LTNINNSFIYLIQWGQKNCNPDVRQRTDHDEVERCLVVEVGSGKLPGDDEKEAASLQPELLPVLEKYYLLKYLTHHHFLFLCHNKIVLFFFFVGTRVCFYFLQISLLVVGKE
jgi:hypothetical protein